MSEINREHIKALAREILVLCEDIPAEIRQPKEKAPSGTSFKLITRDTKDFSIQDVAVSKIYPIKEGTSKAGHEYQKQSIIVTDSYGETRELVAWREEDIKKFDTLRVGDVIDAYGLESVSEYQQKHQYKVGKDTTIKVIENAGGNHVL